ncbi:Metallo-beta-lactamase superfamily protein [Pedobacter westerhofensis]|uniref:Metallo-beta-lactamase superfamily protein n=1 Tax=Pedobacter westerhofensis TaxID=425512 RepID=A0A521FQQ7_9SPHI|nr:MBL fold metallo-hydrolase [Pedobacter westerhofensis]SMO98557.1 Metallo-beta-lactamase superfamily protein [Pedobacter westerhofensis]
MQQADPNALSSNKNSFINAIKVFKPYQVTGKIKTFRGNSKLFPGLRAVATPGHTLGHTLFVLEDLGEKVVFCGDLIHIAVIQFASPD